MPTADSLGHPVEQVREDVAVEGIRPLGPGLAMLGAGALLAAMTSPYVGKHARGGGP